MSENPLLVSAPRRTARVELVHRKDLTVFVLMQNAGEGMRYLERIRDKTGQELICESLAETVCDADGRRLLTVEEAGQFVELITGDDLKAILTAGKKINSMSEESLETTEKN